MIVTSQIKGIQISRFLIPSLSDPDALNALYPGKFHYLKINQLNIRSEVPNFNDSKLKP